MHIPIFPENGLANSVIPPVLVGLGFSTAFAETLGWNFSGLIVPGYLAPIFIVKPLSGVVIIIEALITYVLLRLLSDGFSRFGIWTRFFGQDAFFALFCISILVKYLLEGPFLPVMGGVFSQILPGSVDYRNELHSTGLVVVPLMANIFWRHGIRRNILPTTTVIFLTFLFTRFVLIPYTNFTVNKFELMYSKMAINFEESPQFYFILVIGALMASHNKYRYGWTYHGMLIPALLGIAWLTPLKILTTFAEAGLILIIGWYVVRSRIMQNLTIEGPRKLLLLFSIGFFLKMVTGFAVSGALPGFQATDLYGFAYILPALLAMEMWPGRYFFKVARVTMQTSLLAAFFGLLACAVFQQITPGTAPAPTRIQLPVGEVTQTGSGEIVSEQSISLKSWVTDGKESRLSWGSNHIPAELNHLSLFDQHVLTPLIRAVVHDQELSRTPQMETTLRKVNYRLTELSEVTSGERFWVLSESGQLPSYHGIYIFRTGSAASLAVQVPNPLAEYRTLEFGFELFDALNARALFVSGSSRRRGIAEFDVTHLDNKESVFQLMHQAFHRESYSHTPVLSLQIRGAADLSALHSDAVLSTGEEIRGETGLCPELVSVEEKLEQYGLIIHPFSGNLQDTDYSTRSNAQQIYTRDFDMGTFAVLWVSRELRDCHRNQQIKSDLIDAIGWPVKTGSLEESLLETGARSTDTIITADIRQFRNSIQTALQDYSKTGHAGNLQIIRDLSLENAYQIVDFTDESRAVHCLWLQPEDPMNPTFVFNYNAHNPDTIVLDPSTETIENVVKAFFLSRRASLTVLGDRS
jgi:gamma-polyglutamate biosynthesis protein CapC